ncbi:MAG TPA: IniB N-terminal domain-containing protein [Actinophytocola sp.]|uniref:IniB N-terminal domain-containing protein n=1 Tax=Actinophytocola sp. TaxID=1872138 RepID=UPI002DDD383F|nr:IniB N-terminal domain-containing protein [Actinophytocola sp.]HEV2783762.1 IniB N-terminal domain-containing protein [Actinophytocola sp.]
MQAVSAIISFLMSLMSDEETKAAFEQDPENTLARNGLAGITGQDVRDARLIMADDGVCAKRGDESGPGGADPVREIHHTTKHYAVTQHPSVTNVDQTFNLLAIDDRDTLINDSFNKDVENNVVAIQDNDTTDVDVLDVEVIDPVDEPPAGVEPREEPTAAEEPEPTGDPVADEPEPEPTEEPVVAEEPEEPVEDEPDLDAAIV